MAVGVEAQAEPPVLLLGATGFAPAQREVIQSLLARQQPGAARWRLVPFREADAWWIHGARAQHQPDGHLRVKAGLPTEHTLHLDLAHVERPVAFSLPLADPNFTPRFEFRLEDEATIWHTLGQFERWLSLLRAQFVLGALVMRRGGTLGEQVYHLVRNGRLLAVLDWQVGQVGIHPEAEAHDLWQADWHSLAVEEGLPSGFVACTPAQLLWAYVRRTEKQLLPERYRTATIYFRRSPRVPLRWLRDSQLVLLRELTAGGGDFQNLQRRTGLAEAVLALDLSCLYYAGAITTTAARAASGRGQEEGSSSPSELGDSWQPEPSQQPPDLTVPALLEPLVPPRGRET